MGEGIVTSHFGREDGAERDGHRGVSAGWVFFVFHFFYGGSQDRTWLATHGDTEWSVEA